MPPVIPSAAIDQAGRGATVDSALAELIYELLDAHDDTARLARGLEGDLAWDAHLDYLRALQRVGREVLGRGGV